MTRTISAWRLKGRPTNAKVIVISSPERRWRSVSLKAPQAETFLATPMAASPRLVTPSRGHAHAFLKTPELHLKFMHTSPQILVFSLKHGHNFASLPRTSQVQQHACFLSDVDHELSNFYEARDSPDEALRIFIHGHVTTPRHNSYP